MVKKLKFKSLKHAVKITGEPGHYIVLVNEKVADVWIEKNQAIHITFWKELWKKQAKTKIN